MPLSRPAKAHLLLIVITFIWGVTFVTIKNALYDITPLLFNAIRMALACFALAALFPRRLKHLTALEFRAALPVGCLLFLGYTLQTSGLRLTTPSKSGFITGVSVVLVPLFLFLLFRRRLAPAALLGCAAAFLGLALLALPPGNSWSDLRQVNPGDWLTLGCAVAFAFHIILLGRATRRISYQSLALLQTAIAASLMALSTPLLERSHALWTPRVLWAILITALLATALAFAVQSWAQQFISPTSTALIFALEPVFALLTSFFLLHERLGLRGILGCSLILAGILASELLPSKDFPPPSPAS